MPRPSVVLLFDGRTADTVFQQLRGLSQTQNLNTSGSAFFPLVTPVQNTMQAGPAAATRARSALGDISNKGASARNGVQAGKVSSRARPIPCRSHSRRSQNFQRTSLAISFSRAHAAPPELSGRGLCRRNERIAGSVQHGGPHRSGTNRFGAQQHQQRTQ